MVAQKWREISQQNESLLSLLNLLFLDPVVGSICFDPLVSMAAHV